MSAHKRMGMAEKGHAMSTTVFLAVAFLFIMGSASMAIAKAQVEIWNDMVGATSRENVLIVNCDTQKEEILFYGQTLKWQFTPSWWTKSKYACQFRWDRNVQYFVVWMDSTLRTDCYRCEWHVKKDGFCVNEEFEPWLRYKYQWLRP